MKQQLNENLSKSMGEKHEARSSNFRGAVDSHSRGVAQTTNMSFEADSLLGERPTQNDLLGERFALESLGPLVPQIHKVRF
jgi:hypothetical protein